MRILGFLALFLLSTMVHPILLLPLLFLHALSWRAYELLVIGIFIDAYFGVSYPVPYYTLGIMSLLIIVEWLKPHLSFYTEEHV